MNLFLKTLLSLPLRYIAECAPESHRGQLATLWQLAITSGIVLVSILNIWCVV